MTIMIGYKVYNEQHPSAGRNTQHVQYFKSTSHFGFQLESEYVYTLEYLQYLWNSIYNTTLK